MRDQVRAFLQLALDGGHVFHGSPVSFDVLEPHQTTRRSGDGKIVYSAVSAHVTPLLCCALNYMGRVGETHTCGVDLRSVPVREIYVIGPKTRKDAIDHLFGRGGYLYAFPSSAFHRTKGLGMSEAISLDPVAPTRKLRLSLDDLVELMRFCGFSFVFEKRDLGIRA